MHDGVERHERHAHVRRMRRHAGGRGAPNRDAEDGVHAVEAVERVAAGARRALVAACGMVVEVEAARALQQVAAHCRHVANLRRGARQHGARQHRIALSHAAVLSQCRIGGGGADDEPAVVALGNAVRETGHIDQGRRLRDALAHQVDEVGAATQVHRTGVRSIAHRRSGVARAAVSERHHDAFSCGLDWR
jgi:hypothetical protein